MNSPFRLLKGYSPRGAIDNHFKLLENDFDLKAERVLARERIEESQNKYYLSNSGRKNPFDFKEGQFVLVKKMSIAADAGKKLTKKLLGPFLIVRIHEAAVNLFHLTLHKEYKVNINRLVPYKGKITTKMKYLKLMYFPKENNEENDPVTLNSDDEIEIENELSQEAYSNVDEEEEGTERNLPTTLNDQLNNSEDERELRKKGRIEYSPTSNNTQQQTELVWDDLLNSYRSNEKK